MCGTTKLEIENIIMKLNSNKSSRIDKISTKEVKLVAHIIKKPLTKIVNATIQESKFVHNAKNWKNWPDV